MMVEHRIAGEEHEDVLEWKLSLSSSGLPTLSVSNGTDEKHVLQITKDGELRLLNGGANIAGLQNGEGMAIRLEGATNNPLRWNVVVEGSAIVLKRDGCDILHIGKEGLHRYAYVGKSRGLPFDDDGRVTIAPTDPAAKASK